MAYLYNLEQQQKTAPAFPSVSIIANSYRGAILYPIVCTFILSMCTDVIVKIPNVLRKREHRVLKYLENKTILHIPGFSRSFECKTIEKKVGYVWKTNCKGQCYNNRKLYKISDTHY